MVVDTGRTEAKETVNRVLVSLLTANLTQHKSEMWYAEKVFDTLLSILNKLVPQLPKFFQ